jgi:hypothetical protein
MIVGKARNVLVQEVLAQSPAEVIWFVDQDILLPAHAGVLIDQALKFNIMSGLYFNRHNPYTPQMYRLSPFPGEEGMYESLIKYPTAGFMHADAVGAGCLAIKRTVLEDMKVKHEARVQAAEALLKEKLQSNGGGRALVELGWLLTYARSLSPWFEFLDQKGEDFYFCERARECGYNIWVNLDVKCEHISQLNIGEGHFQYLRESGLLIRVGQDGKPLDERIPQPTVTEVPK